ncbi:pseudouridine synthase [Thermodesulfobacteriota bacterium]
MRINRILSLAGLVSRRKADELIKNGRVVVNDRTVREAGAKALWGVDSIKVDGQEVPFPSERTYVMLNKPFGYLSSLSDPAGRPLANDLLKDIKTRLYPVGRLDFDSLGLLLLTNDGEWTYRLTHPRFHVPKTYKLTLDNRLTHEAQKALQKGLWLEDGFSGPAKVTPLGKHTEAKDVRLTITSGKSRLVRRMIEAAGFRVVHLIRIGFGILELGDLKIGQYRYLEEEEVQAMKKMVGLD